MKFGEFYNLTESDKDGVFANISKRIDDLEKKVNASAAPGDAPKYTCVPSQSEDNDILIIIDVEKGTMAGRLNTRGRLISHPLVYGNKVAFAIQREVGGRSDRLGVIHLLPSGQVHNQFRITGDAAEGTKTNPIFRKEEDTERIWNIEVEKWINSLDSTDPDIIALRNLIIGTKETQDNTSQNAAEVPAPEPAQPQAPAQQTPEYGQAVTSTAQMSPRQEVPTWAQAARADLAAKRQAVTDPAPRPVQHRGSTAAERIRRIRQTRK